MAKTLLRPFRFRFTDPDDVAAYGDRWWPYDENQIVRRPARELIELEQEVGMPIAAVMNGVRASSVAGDLAGSWIALKLAGTDVPFDDFSPVVMLIEWEGVPDDEPADSAEAAEGPLEPAPDTVSLVTMPPTV